jgi:RNA polymerase sigma-70 factor, ECF subfamily
MPDRGSNAEPEKNSALAAAYLARAATGSAGKPAVATPIDPMHGQTAAAAEQTEPTTWLDRFYGGDRKILEEIYQGQFDRIDAAVGTVLAGADRETVVHEVFLRLLRDLPFRRLFRGGDVGAWLAVVARNQAIDYSRRRNRESPSGIDLGSTISTGDELARSAEARLLIERFLRDVLPPTWLAVFQARFIAHLSQAEAAARLGKRRTTLAYQELRIRRLLRKFLLEDA